jgi:hypothetical protein
MSTNNKNNKVTVAQEGEHYSVWLRQEHHTHYRIPRGVANSLEEAVQLVRDCVTIITYMIASRISRAMKYLKPKYQRTKL